MHEKYHYKSDWFYFVGFSMIASAFFVPFVIVGVANDGQIALGYGLFIGWFVILGAILLLLEFMPASFHAEADSVTFCLLFRRICIPYSSIDSIKVTRYYTRVIIRGDVPHYVEEMCIVCGDNEYNFHAPMQIDMQKAAVKPEKLKEQFENGIFKRLQKYIESQK